ncbi:ribosomal protein L1p/L10e family-domain-containing protein [Ostreococcus tauri]|uniref:Ribosomal protein L1p/L10e family-domain-containing protein n=1 Tax=Ostreococcus tauri TaxID=70448 RepID=A0A1Y5IE07_OSTTA|nr:ribosomal protein L1p/L10e family-domain-containing protein [Ostreococcus tauri]
MRSPGATNAAFGLVVLAGARSSDVFARSNRARVSSLVASTPAPIDARSFRALEPRARKPEKRSSSSRASTARSSTKKTNARDDGLEAAAAATSARVDVDQVRKAVSALATHLEKVANEKPSSALFDDEAETYHALISLRRTPKETTSARLIAVPIPHPLLDLSTAELCLIVKDHQGEGHKEAKQRVAEMAQCGVAKVLGISKLKANYKAHEQKRKLCDSYDMFLADDRVIPILPKLLGKNFFKKKKQPVAVDLTKKDWVAQVKRAVSATYMHIAGGTCVNVKVGKSTMGEDEIVENIMAAIAGAVHKIPRRWGNVQSIYIKTPDSVALPIFAAPPDE